jgi:ABC-type glycerol-3-phosphate transport system substrate-binding protein
MRHGFRLLALFALISIVAMATYAGGQGEESASGAEEIVEITVWDWWQDSSGAQGVFVEALDAEFERQHPNIRVVHEAVPHPPYDVYNAALVAREGADVILIHANGQNFQDLSDALVELDPYIEDMRDQFPEATLADTSPERRVENGVFGLPVTVQGWVWYYNKALFEEAGLDPENPPTTWEGFLDAAEQLQAAGIIPVGFGQGIHLEMMIAGTLDQVLSTEEKRGLLTGETTFSHPDILATFERFQNLFQEGYMDRDGLTVPLLRDMGEKFMRGETAIFRGFVSDIFNWYEFSEALGAENVGVIPNFHFSGSAQRGVVGAAAGVAYAVPKYSEEQEAAAEYVKFAASAQGANLLLQNTGGVPANLEADKSLVASPAGNEVLELVGQSLVPPTKAFTPTPMWNVLRSHSPLLITGELTPEEFAEAIEGARE